MRRKGSDVSVIQDIVKKKHITFLKSSQLFTQKEQLFGGIMHEFSQNKNSPSHHVPSTHSPQSKHQQALE